MPSGNRKPYLDALLKIENVRRETLLIGIYFVVALFGKDQSLRKSNAQLCEKFNLRQSNVSRAIKQLMESKFVKVTQDPTDKRFNLYKLNRTQNLAR